jgi:hypothetical protein
MHIDRRTWLIAILSAGLGLTWRLFAAAPAAPVAPAAAPAPPPGVSVDSAIIQKDGDTLRLLNATLNANGQIRHVDLSLQFSLAPDGKIHLDSLDARPTSLVGVNALVPGTYEEGNQQFELVGPAFDIDLRGSWSIKGPRVNGTIIAGPPVGNPLLIDAKGVDALPAVGLYGMIFHDRVFAGFPNSAKTLINFRQVGDTLVLTAYAPQGEHFNEVSTVVLKRKKPE